MKRQYRAALGIAGIVLLTTALGAAAFLYFGSTLGVYAVGVGAPLVVVVAIGLYVRGTVARRNTTEGEFTRSMAESVASSFREELSRLNRLSRDYPRWDAAEAKTDAQHLADSFESAGIDVDVDDGSYRLETLDSVHKLEELEGDVESFSATISSSFAKFAREEVDRSRAAADEVQSEFLDEGGDPFESVTISAPGGDSPDVSEAERTIERSRDVTREVFDRAIDRIERTVGEYGGDRANLQKQFQSIRDHLDVGEWESAIEKLDRARERVERSTAEEFSADRDALVSLLGAIDDAEVDPYLSEQQRDRISSVRSQLEEMESALSTDQLESASADVRRVAIDVVSTLRSDLEAADDTVEGSDVPPEFYTTPDAIYTNYAEELRSADDLGTFTERWETATEELLAALDTAEEKAAVADSYDIVSERIEEALRKQGEVDGDDLPVKEPERFFELYAQDEPRVTFDERRGVLVTGGSGETYDLDVTAELADDSAAAEEVTVELDGENATERETAAIGTSTTVTFDDVPYGSYTVTASVPAEAIVDTETTIELDDDAAERLVLSERSLRDRLCGDHEDAVEDQLPTVAPELEDRFEEDGYLTPDTDLPIADDYLPCLLLLWADDAGYTARMDDGRLLVYDHERFVSRLRTLVTHHLDDETLTYDDMRTKFLSVPASDELITTTLTELDLDVTVTDDGVSA